LIFNYPEPRIHRRHGPKGYASYSSYRPWLRDEFTFRCVYCLKQEQWGQATGEFEVDHFQPQAFRPDRAADYSNLVYACRRCNSVKLDHEVADPFAMMCVEQIRILPDGTLRGLSQAATKLMMQLDLNSPRMTEWRILWMRIVDLAKQRDPLLLKQLIGFPKNLPNLKNLRPPAGNSRLEGIMESWAYLSKQGKLPDSY
jgi:5-methylcytosine-specific restriction endonuclease McrA